ncbi:MAG TPA: amidohydrolase family protein [Acidimicrobiia bacterium]|nr:amidohydrolase family protein [Acidimicrobiia bacterium]
MTTGDEATMDAYEVEKEYWDDGPEIEAVNIHYLWTPVGEDPEWETHRVTRFMPPSRAEGAGRRHRSRTLRIPARIPDPASGGLTDRFLLHHYFEIFEHGRRRYSPRYTEEITTGAGGGTAPRRRTGAGRARPGTRRAPVGFDIGALESGAGPGVGGVGALGALGTLGWYGPPEPGGGRRIAYRGPLRGDALRLHFGYDGWKEPGRDTPLETVEDGLAVTAPLDVDGHLTVEACVTDGGSWDNNHGVDYRLWIGVDPVDGHLHASGTGHGAFGRPSLEVAMASAGMVAGVVSWFDNTATERLVRAGAGLYPLVWVAPGATPVEEVADRLADGFVGIKLHPTLDGYPGDDPALDPYLKVAAAAGRPVAVHSAPGDADPNHIRRLAERHPSVPVILYHTYLGPAEGRRRAVKYLGEHPNLYLETSWCRWKAVVRFVEAVGPERVLFGSDASVDGPAHYRRQPPNVEGAETYNDGLLALVRALGPEAARTVLAGTTRRLFRLDEEPGQSNPGQSNPGQSNPGQSNVA